MKFDDEAISEMFGEYSFRKLADPEEADSFLKEYADRMKGECPDRYEEMLYNIERKHWVESGFNQEGFRVLKEVILGHWNTDFLSPFEIRKRRIKKKPILEYLHFFAEKSGVLVEAELGLLGRSSYAIIWAEIEVPWSFTGGGVEFEVNGNFHGAVERIAKFYGVAGAYKNAVVETIWDLAQKHRLTVNCVWHVTDVCAYPRKNFAGALRRIQSFLAEYDPEEIRKKALRMLDSQNSTNHDIREAEKGCGAE